MIREDIYEAGTPRAGQSPSQTPTQPRSPALGAFKKPALPVIEALSLEQHQRQLEEHGNDDLATPVGSGGGGRQPTYHHLNPGHFPPEIVHLIIMHLYYSILPPPEPFPSPDPYLHLLPRENAWTPPRLAPPRPEQLRATFRSLALVDKTWGEEATRALWRKVSFGFPKSWEGVLKVVEEYDQGRRMQRAKRPELGDSGWSFKSIAGIEDVELRGRSIGVPTLSDDTKWAKLAGSGPNGSMVMEAVPDHELANALSSSTGDELLDSLKLPTSLNAADSPLLYTKTISFSRFRTAGMSRSLRQGSHERFVTSQRLLKLLRGTRLGKGSLSFPGADHDAGMYDEDDDEDYEGDDRLNGEVETKIRQTGRLEGLAFTEFMDSALSKAVLDELLFRGGYLAEYEEDEDHPHHHEGYLSQHDASASDSDTTAPSPAASPFIETATLPFFAEPFNARHLQSSHSRSPIGERRFSLSSSIVTEEDTPELEDDAMDEDEDAEENVEARSGLTPAGRFSSRSDRSPEDVRGRLMPARHALQRRSSGSAFAAPLITGDVREESEERGRDRVGRNNTGSGLRGRQRFNRSLVPPSAFASRSSSVPAPFHERGAAQTAFSSKIRGTSLDTERSSSVPASASGRRARGQIKIVQVLEGSKQVRAIRALDLCACISKVFVRAIEECINTYRLGPPALLPDATSSSITAITEDESDDGNSLMGVLSQRSSDSQGVSGGSVFGHSDSMQHRKLRRIYFPHFRRLGLASSLLPTNLLTSFVLSFPYLTHLDLAGTLASTALLKGLALAGQSGPGGRVMRLKALNLARCRLMTGAAIVGLFCGDCPPFTSHAGMEADESWGNGEVVSELIDCSLFGDATTPSPLSPPELRLLLTVSPAFTSGRLRTLDLSSTPLTDTALIEHFAPQPQLVELGFANCRAITMRGVAQFLIDKAPNVEVLDLSNAVPGAQVVAPSSAQRRATFSSPILSIFELHTTLLKSVASVAANLGESDENCQILLALRKTNLRVVELDEKALDAVQGGAGNWKPIWGKGRRGWYVDVATTSVPDKSPLARGPRKLVHLPQSDPQRQALQRLYEQNGSVTSETGWHARKMEVIRGDGMMGREEGLYAYQAFSV